MKDKLYKTNKKTSFYRFRSFMIGVFFLGLGAAALTLPYPYVVKAINAYQAENAPTPEAVVDEVVDEVLPLV